MFNMPKSKASRTPNKQIKKWVTAMVKLAELETSLDFPFVATGPSKNVNSESIFQYGFRYP